MGTTTLGRARPWDAWATPRRLGWMALALALVTAGLITYGSWVRVSASGLGCPDWPLCESGSALPGGTTASRIEYGHRLLAGVTMVLVWALGFLAFRRRHEMGGAWKLTALAALLILAQAILGGVTVLTHLPGWVRLAHLAMGMILVGVLTSGGLMVLSREWQAAPARLQALPLLLIAAAIILAGGSIVATHTSFGCLDLPLCDSSATAKAAALHTLHRSLGLLLVAAAGVAGYVIKRRGASRPALAAFAALAGFLVAQMLLGALSIAVEFPDGMRILHVALASLIWLSLVAFWTLAGGPDLSGR